MARRRKSDPPDPSSEDPKPKIVRRTTRPRVGDWMQTRYWRTMHALEKDLLTKALIETGGSITAAAELLGISYRYLRVRVELFGLQIKQIKQKPRVVDLKKTDLQGAIGVGPEVTERQVLPPAPAVNPILEAERRRNLSMFPGHPRPAPDLLQAGGDLDDDLLEIMQPAPDLEDEQKP